MEISFVFSKSQRELDDAEINARVSCKDPNHRFHCITEVSWDVFQDQMGIVEISAYIAMRQQLLFK